jgi:hypothetical protein
VRSSTTQAAPSLTLTSPDSGATVSLPFTIAGFATPGSTVAYVNDSTENSLGASVTSDATTGAYSFTVTSTGA